MVAIEEHVLALPFGLPGQLDGRLARYLADENWAAALTLLRDLVNESTTNPKWLLLLAYSRFRDVSDVMVEELADGAREALSLIDRATSHAASYDAVAPLRHAVEEALDQATREELRLHALVPEGAALTAVEPDVLEALAFTLWRSNAARAAALFEAHAVAVPAGALVSRARAALCLAESGRFDANVRRALEHAFASDWTAHRRDRTVLEAVEVMLLLHATGAEFDVQWRASEQKSREVDLPFPSVWPNQERLLAHCIVVGDRAHAAALAERIGSSRDEVSRALDDLMRRALTAPA